MAVADKKNKVLYGLKNVHIAVLDTASGTYGLPIPVPGAVNLKASPEGETSTFFADDGPYFQLTSNSGYTGDLEVAIVPDAILTAVFGMEIDKNGMNVEIGDAQPKPFALMAEIKGDASKRRTVWWNCSATRPESEHGTTEDKTEPTTEKMSWSALPIDAGARNIVKGCIEPSAANQKVYDAFFKKVIMPDEAIPVV